MTHEGKIRTDSKRLDKLQRENREAQNEAKKLAEVAVDKHTAQCELVAELEGENQQKIDKNGTCDH